MFDDVTKEGSREAQGALFISPDGRMYPFNQVAQLWGGNNFRYWPRARQRSGGWVHTAPALGKPVAATEERPPKCSIPVERGKSYIVGMNEEAFEQERKWLNLEKNSICVGLWRRGRHLPGREKACTWGQNTVLEGGCGLFRELSASEGDAVCSDVMVGLFCAGRAWDRPSFGHSGITGRCVPAGGALDEET